jgi:hypothetical protein
MSYIFRNVVLSYPQLFTAKTPPNARPGQKPRFSCMILIPKEMDILDIQQACLKLLEDKWADKVEAMMKMPAPNNLKWPFRTDNVKQDGSPRYDQEKYKCFFTCWSESPPGLVERYAGQDGKPKKILAPSADLLYPGCFVNVSVNPFVFDQTGNRGIALGLQNVQMWDKGERLDNRVAAEDQFQAEERPPVDLSQMHTPAAGQPTQASRAGALANLFT